MRTRTSKLIVALALGLFAWSLAADAQQPAKVPRVGILSDELRSPRTYFEVGVARGLRDLGYIEGQNIAFERRYPDGKLELLPHLPPHLVPPPPPLIFSLPTNPPP